MNKPKLFKRMISFVLTVSLTMTILTSSTINVFSLEEQDLTSDGMKLGYSTLNGYTKLVLKNHNMKSTQKTAVYCGLDISNPYTLVLVGLFYLNQNVDLDKLTKDNSYAIETIAKLNVFLNKMGVKNKKAEEFKNNVLSSYENIYQSFDTIGIYIFEAENQESLELMNNEYVDFVLVGGEVPKSLKDMNFDGKTDKKDALLIQKYLSKELQFTDKDENAYALYASDINADRSIDIVDVTDLQLQNIK